MSFIKVVGILEIHMSRPILHNIYIIISSLYYTNNT